MTTQPAVVRQSDLLNQLVLDRATMEELGRLELLWMYPQSHRVLGFIAKSGFLGAKKSAFKLNQISALGSSGILTHSPPEATDAEKVRQLESLLQHEIWSDTGNRVGKITDCLFNLKTGDITQYLFVSSGWGGVTGEVYQLPPTQILSFGKKRVLVAEATVTRLAVYQEGIHQKLTKAKDLLKTEAVQEWQAIAQQAESVTEQAKGRWQHLAEQAKERAQQLSQRAKEKAQVLNEQLQEETQTWVEKARETSQTLAEQVKERTETLSKQVEEGIQTLTVQAEEILDAIPEKPIATPPPPPTDFSADFPTDFSMDFPTDSPADSTTAPDSSPASTPQATPDELDDDDEPWI